MFVTETTINFIRLTTDDLIANGHAAGNTTAENAGLI